MNWYKKSQVEDYRGLHTAPDKSNGSPIFDLSGIYPPDIYSSNATRYYGHYGHGDHRDSQSIAIIQELKNKPNATVRIYRAVPYLPTTQEKIIDLEKQKKYILRHGKIPPNADTKMTDKSKYYDYISEELDKLRQMPIDNKEKTSINVGDWVTINREYAKAHGESLLKGKYTIVSKVVKAKDIYTVGDSIHEWGYDP